MEEKDYAQEEDGMYYHITVSSLGPLLLAGDESGLKYLKIQNGKKPLKIPEVWEENRPFFSEVSRQLEAYFSGKLEVFDIKLNPEGSEFQKSVWKALSKIPYGETRTYGEIAKKIGKPKASRAVGLANSRNPVSIIIPCHRVIGANGKLTGYASGLEVKEFLLRLEENKDTEYHAPRHPHN